MLDFIENNTARKVVRVVSSTLATLFVIVGTIAMISYANGYRIGKSFGVTETGVFNINSDPRRADIYIDDEYKGRTSETITSMEPGSYKVEIKRDDYRDWQTTATIKAQRTTQVYAPLYLVEPNINEVFKLDQKVIETYSDKNSQYIFVLTEKELTQIERIEPEPQTEDDSEIETEESEPTQESNQVEIVKTDIGSNYRVWRFQKDQSFWSTSQNPILVYEENINIDEGVKSVEMKPSSDGNYLLMQYKGETITTVSAEPDTDNPDETEIQEEDIIEEFTTYKLYDGNVNNKELKNRSIEDITKDEKVYWSNNNEHLIAVGPESVISIDIRNSSRYLLYKGETNQLTWATDDNGYFYRVLKNNEDIEVAVLGEQNENQDQNNENTSETTNGNISDTESHNSYNIVRTPLISTESQVQIRNLSLTTNEEILDSFDFMEGNYDTDSLEKISSQIDQNEEIEIKGNAFTFIDIHDSGDTIVLSTDLATYYFDVAEGIFTPILDKEIQYLHFASDNRKILLKAQDEIYTFGYDKEQFNHTQFLGTQFTSQIEPEADHIMWSGNSYDIFYRTENTFHVMDYKGENNYTLIEDVLFANPNADGELIYVIPIRDEDEPINNFLEYEIREDIFL